METKNEFQIYEKMTETNKKKGHIKINWDTWDLLIKNVFALQRQTKIEEKKVSKEH